MGYSSFTFPEEMNIVMFEKPTHQCSGYLTSAIEPKKRRKLIAKCFKFLKGEDFDTIVVRGISGMLLGPILAHKTGKELLVIRKTDERTASWYKHEGHIALKRYIFVDDLISTYSTVVVCQRYIQENINSTAELVGILLYSNSRSEPDGASYHDEYSRIVTEAKLKAANKSFEPSR